MVENKQIYCTKWKKRSSIYQTIDRPFEWFAANDAVHCYLISLFTVFYST